MAIRLSIHPSALCSSVSRLIRPRQSVRPSCPSTILCPSVRLIRPLVRSLGLSVCLSITGSSVRSASVRSSVRQAHPSVTVCPSICPSLSGLSLHSAFVHPSVHIRPVSPLCVRPSVRPYQACPSIVRPSVHPSISGLSLHSASVHPSVISGLSLHSAFIRPSIHIRPVHPLCVSRSSLTFDSFSSFRLLDHLHHPMNIPDSIDLCSTHVLLL
jgi:hypothetical protein